MFGTFGLFNEHPWYKWVEKLLTTSPVCPGQMGSNYSRVWEWYHWLPGSSDCHRTQVGRWKLNAASSLLFNENLLTLDVIRPKSMQMLDFRQIWITGWFYKSSIPLIVCPVRKTFLGIFVTLGGDFITSYKISSTEASLWIGWSVKGCWQLCSWVQMDSTGDSWVHSGRSRFTFFPSRTRVSLASTFNS